MKANEEELKEMLEKDINYYKMLCCKYMPAHEICPCYFPDFEKEIYGNYKCLYEKTYKQLKK